MTKRQRVALMVVGALVVLLGAVVVVAGPDEDAEVTAEAAEGDSTTTTTESSSTTAAGLTTTTTAVATTTAGDAPPAPTTSTTTAGPGRSGPEVGKPPGAPVPPAPPFRSSITTVTAAQLGASWREGCPLGPDQLRLLTVSYWGYDGSVREGRLVVEAAQADRVLATLRDVYEARFPIERMETIDRYGGDDQASMRANNTSGFNCRYVAGTTRWSEHSFGRAVDINPLVNPYVKGSSVDPPEGAPYADRSQDAPGMIRAGDAVVQAFERQGWQWGGYWSSGKDYQHFSASGR